MKHLGFDYSGSAMYCGIVDDTVDHLSATASLKLKDNSDPKQCVEFFNNLRRLFSLCADPENDFCKDAYIEQPWINGKHFPRSAVLLTRMSTYIELALLEEDFVPRFVHPMTWRSKIYGTSRIKNAKEVAINYVKEKFEYETKDHNLAEALIIAHYGALINVGTSKEENIA